MMALCSSKWNIFLVPLVGRYDPLDSEPTTPKYLNGNGAGPYSAVQRPGAKTTHDPLKDPLILLSLRQNCAFLPNGLNYKVQQDTKCGTKNSSNSIQDTTYRQFQTRNYTESAHSLLNFLINLKHLMGLTCLE